MAFHQINIGGGSYTLAPQQVKPTSSAVSANRPIPFLSGLGSTDGLTARTIYTDTENNLYYDPSTNTLTAGKFVGYIATDRGGSWSTSAHNGEASVVNDHTGSGGALVCLASMTAKDGRITIGTIPRDNSYFYFSYHKTGNTSVPNKQMIWDYQSNILKVPQVNGNLYGAVQTISSNNTDASYYISFVNYYSTAMRYSYVDVNLKYNPKTNILTTTQFDGKLNGPAYTYASGTNASYYISFVNASSNGMRYSYVDSGLIYNPSTNTLTAGKLCGYLVSDKQGSWSTSAHNGQAAVVNDATGSGGNLVCLASMTAKGGRITMGTRPTTNSFFCFSYHKTGNTSTPDKTMIWDYQANTLSTSGGFYETSDERLKDLQEDIEVNFSYLHNIPKKYYSWKDDYTYTRHIGTSAQEVQKYYPELVNTGDDGYLTMNYDKLSVVALKAIDVLHEEVTELKKENAELKERLARLEELILNR